MQKTLGDWNFSLAPIFELLAAKDSQTSVENLRRAPHGLCQQYSVVEEDLTSEQHSTVCDLCDESRSTWRLDWSGSLGSALLPGGTIERDSVLR